MIAGFHRKVNEFCALEEHRTLGVVLSSMVDDTKPHGITFMKTIIFIIICREASYLTGIFSGHSLQEENMQI